MIEIWKPIPIKPFDENYEASNFGKIKRISKGSNCTYIGKILKPFLVANYHYYAVKLYYNNKKRMFRLAKLIALTFIPNPENKPEINHKDGNKTNNSADNLEWNTRLENAKHAVINGLYHHSKLTNNQVKEIRYLYKKGSKQIILAKKYKVDPSHISDIVNYKSRCHV